jgi:hypothetical protein
MSKIIKLSLGFILFMTLSGCDVKENPVSNDKIIADLSSYVIHLDNIKEIILVDVESTSYNEKDFTAKVSVKFKDKYAIVEGIVDVAYYEAEKTWVRKSPSFTVSAATPYAQPDIEEILSAIPSLKREHIELDDSFDYSFEPFTLTGTSLDYLNNRILYEVTSVGSALNCNVSLKLDIDLRYTYALGWQAVAVTSENFNETCTWSGTFNATFSEPVYGVKTFPIILEGMSVYEINDDFSSVTTNTIHASFKLGGIQYEVDGGLGLYSESVTGREVTFYYDQAHGKALTILIDWTGNFAQLALGYHIDLNGKMGQLTPVE